MEKIRTNILIIGGGLSGMMAALEASKLSSSILLVSKGKVGKSGATFWAGANFAAALPDAIEKGDSVRAHIEDTLAAGGDLNDLKLLSTLAENASGDLLLLESLGVNFLKKEGQFDLRKPPGHRNARTVYTLNEGVSLKIRGKTITEPLRQVINQKKIKCLERVSIVQLVTKKGRLAGAVGLEKKTGEMIAIECEAAVIASGGGGALYAMNTNPGDLTGDSYSLALEAGCLLRDMEYVQFFPCWHLSLPHVNIHTTLFSDGAVLRNKDGKRFMAQYEPEKMELATRDSVSLSIFKEIKEGRGINGGVYADLTAIPSELMSFRFPDFLKKFQKHGINLRKDWVRVAPAAHFFMGGIVINEHCHTTIPGLFAAGEATGGIHGGNRLSGNGLSDPLVFGRIAGREAALHDPINSEAKKPQVDFELKKKLKEEKISKSGVTEIKNKIKKLMTEKVGIIRNKNALRQAHEELRSLRRFLGQRQPDSRENLFNYCDVHSMLTTSLAVTGAALFREESRGAHFREDFPVSKKELSKSIYVKMENGEVKTFFYK